MKRVLLLVLFTVFITSEANALILFPEVTNFSESTENSPGLGFFPLHNPQASLESISDGWYAWGTAFEFNLEQSFILKSISSPIAASRHVQNNVPVPGRFNMNLTLYRGSTDQFRGETLPNGQVIPITNDPVLSRDFTAFGHDLIPLGAPEGRVYTYQGPNNLHVPLKPGKYWATYFDGSVVTYVQPKVKLEGAVVPEPASMFLLASGLSAMALRRRKRG